MKDTFYAIIDIQQDDPRFTYADAKKTKGAMAIYDKKPIIAKEWKPYKKIVMVSVEVVEDDL